MNKWIVAGGLIGIMAFTGCANSSTNSSNTNLDVATAYTATVVAQHAKQTDCWTIIDQKVYDVTDYIPNHPGGRQITQACGTDATGMFNGTSAMGRMHSAAAKALLSNYQIGVLE